MNSWRARHDEHGWTMSKRAWASYQESCEAELGKGQEPGGSSRSENNVDDAQAPETVKSVPCLFVHLITLKEMFEADVPALRLVRGGGITEAIYGFGDASGEGYGASWTRGQGWPIA